MRALAETCVSRMRNPGQLAAMRSLELAACIDTDGQAFVRHADLPMHTCRSNADARVGSDGAKISPDQWVYHH